MALDTDFRRRPGATMRADSAPVRRGRRPRLVLARLVLAVATLTVLGVSRTTAQDVGLPIGATPAAAEVEDLEGNTVDLSTVIKARPTLIEFWATWCPVCEALEPRLQTARERFGDRVGFVIIGVGVNQTPRRIQRHLDDHPAVGPVYYDRRGAAVRAFMTPTTSYVVILDAAGKVAYTGTGEDQPIVETLGRLLGSQ